MVNVVIYSTTTQLTSDKGAPTASRFRLALKAIDIVASAAAVPYAWSELFWG
jgi:hypothetical protein